MSSEGCTRLHGHPLAGFRVKAARRVGSECTYLVWRSISSPIPSRAAPTVMTTGPTRYQVRVPVVLGGCPLRSGRGWWQDRGDTWEWGALRAQGSARAGLCEQDPTRQAEGSSAACGGLPARTLPRALRTQGSSQRRGPPHPGSHPRVGGDPRLPGGSMVGVGIRREGAGQSPRQATRSCGHELLLTVPSGLFCAQKSSTLRRSGRLLRPGPPRGPSGPGNTSWCTVGGCRRAGLGEKRRVQPTCFVFTCEQVWNKVTKGSSLQPRSVVTRPRRLPVAAGPLLGFRLTENPLAWVPAGQAGRAPPAQHRPGGSASGPRLGPLSHQPRPSPASHSPDPLAQDAACLMAGGCSPHWVPPPLPGAGQPRCQPSFGLDASTPALPH